MLTIGYILAWTVSLFIGFIQLMMFIRVLLNILPMDEGPFHYFSFAVTEPFVIPVRIVFDKFGWQGSLPIDIPFFVTYLLLSLISIFL